MNIKADDEAEFVDELEGEFEYLGWECEREVFTDDGSGRADLLVTTNELPWIGIEAKYMLSAAKSQPTAAAIQQVHKYRSSEFGGRNIKYWAIAPYIFRHPHNENAPARVKDRYLKGIMNGLGFGYVHTHKPYPHIMFGKGSEHRIQVRNPPDRLPSGMERVAMERPAEWML